ncbi:MAG: hypothetical protein MJZ76_00805 [Bacteroidales bacterium]|nr:hypothetical protein [Bacteroidales bacterium]
MGKFAMKHFFVILFCTVFLCGCHNKQTEIVIIPDIEKNHLQRNHLFGQIKEIDTESIILLKDSTGKFIEGDTLSQMIQHYSADGYLVSLVKLNKNNDTLSNEIITYSPDVKELTHEIFDKNNQLFSKTEFAYNRFGFKEKENYYIQDSLLYSIDYKTDDRGNVVEMTYNNGSISEKSKISYNKAGLVARIDDYEPSGKLFKYATIEYDNYGDEVNRRVFKTGDELIEYTYTEYDAKGKLLKIIYEDRLHKVREVSKYSNHDASGNWTYEVKTTNDQPVYCRKRNIKYY